MSDPASQRRKILVGTACGLAAAVGYSAANVCLRQVASCDPVWVSAVKSIPTVLLAAPIVAWQYWGQSQQVLTWRAAVALALSGLLGQVGGNVLFQWSLGVVGLALAVPLCLGGQIISSGFLGRVFLGETVSAQRAFAIGILIVATAVLSSGAADAHRSVSLEQLETTNVWQLATGVGAAFSSGFSYALLGVVIRRSVQGKTSIAATLLVVCIAGTISLGAWSPWRIGWSGMMATEPLQLAAMLLAGTFNFVAFWALTKALQLTPVVYVNALNVTQASLAAVAGVVLFRESPSIGLVAGVVLTAIGLLMMRGR
ncbi:MAG: DMT family transporter [Pirellulales bacterium]